MPYSRRNGVPKPGQVPYVWVEDVSTGHRYDVPRSAVRPGMTPVPGYALNWTGQPRATKHRVDKAGAAPPPRSATPPPQPATPEQAAETTDSPPPEGAARVASTTRKGSRR